LQAWDSDNQRGLISISIGIANLVPLY